MCVDEYCGRGAMAADDLQDLGIAELREAAAAELRGRRHAENAEARKSVDDVARDVGIAIDGGGVDVVMCILLQFRDRFLDGGPLLRVEFRIREQQRGLELSKKERLRESEFHLFRKEKLLGLFLLLLHLSSRQRHRTIPPSNARLV